MTQTATKTPICEHTQICKRTHYNILFDLSLFDLLLFDVWLFDFGLFDFCLFDLLFDFSAAVAAVGIAILRIPVARR